MIKKISSAMLACLVMAGAITMYIMPMPKASAWSGQQLPMCSTTGTDLNFKWKDTITSSLAWKGGDDTKNYDVDSYPGSIIMLRNNGNPYGSDKFWVIFGSSDLSQNYFQKDSYGYAFRQETSSSTFDTHLNDALAYSFYNTSHSLYISSGSYNSNNLTPADTGTLGQGTSYDITCIEFAHGFSYRSGYDGYQYNSAVASQNGGCNTFDIACKIGGFFSGVSNDILNVGRAIVNAIASIFIPDGTQIQADFTSFQTFLTNKLGFLTYPLTFITGVFNAFTDTGTSCSASSCVINFGNLLGQPFSVDLAQPAHTMPTLWSWFCGLTVGITLLELLLAIRRKYMEIVKR